jgi:K+-sensing histidine kinase KdpD
MVTIGKLTLCLSVIEGEDPQRRSIEEAMAAINPSKETLMFIGFTSQFKEKIQSVIPTQYHDNFFCGNIEKHPEILNRILKSSTKAVVFNHIFDHYYKQDRLKLILQLLNAGIDVFTSASLACFELARHDLKDIISLKHTKYLVPTSFFKYISRVILINNFNDAEPQSADCPIRNILATTSEKNLKERLTNMTFVLATHINYQNRHMLSDKDVKPYTHTFPKKIAPILGKTIKVRKEISDLWHKVKQQSFNITACLMNVIVAFFCAHLLSPSTLTNTKLLAFFFTCAFIINLITYSFFSALIGVLFSIGLNFYYLDFHALRKEALIGNLGGFLGFFLLYIIIQNNRIIFQQREELDKKETRFNSLYNYTETLATAANLEEIFHISQQYFFSAFKVEIILILQNLHTLKTQQIITPTSNTIVEQSADELITKQANLDKYGDYEFLPLLTDSVELGWIGINHSGDSFIPLDRTPLNSAILQLTIALQRYNLSKSYQSAVLSSEKEQLRSVILSSISHDLKTPLTTIIGSCTALEEIENLSEKNKMVLVHTIHEASDQLNQFISNILDSSRLATENILQQTSLVYLDDVINVVLHRSKKIIRLFDVSVKVANSEESAIYGDFTLIQQVFYNLIENATKYSPIGGTISIVVNNLIDKIYVRIYDNGPGIIESKRSLIFDKFYRFQHTDQQKAGTGLGLSICKQIIEAYKGKIWVSDRDDGLKGAQFNIELPCAFPKQRTKKQKQGF